MSSDKSSAIRNPQSAVRKRIGVTGATGFVGSVFVQLARERGHEVVAFSRNPARIAGKFSEVRELNPERCPDISGLDAIVHLAGENVFGWWTKKKKRAIHHSRVQTTRRLVEAIGASEKKPEAFVCASAIGYYGNTKDHQVDEHSLSGKGFLAGVVREWEREARRVAEFGVREVRMRIGMVLGREGGAMRLTRTIFSMGLGGRLGSGNQWMSSIHVHDVAGMLLSAVEHKEWAGPVNAVMPYAVTNREFTKMVAEAMRRPAIFPVPGFVLWMLMGELASLLLDSERVVPRRAQELGYEYQFPTVGDAVKDILEGS